MSTLYEWLHNASDWYLKAYDEMMEEEEPRLSKPAGELPWQVIGIRLGRIRGSEEMMTPTPLEASRSTSDRYERLAMVESWWWTLSPEKKVLAGMLTCWDVSIRLHKMEMEVMKEKVISWHVICGLMKEGAAVEESVWLSDFKNTPGMVKKKLQPQGKTRVVKSRIPFYLSQIKKSMAVREERWYDVWVRLTMMESTRCAKAIEVGDASVPGIEPEIESGVDPDMVAYMDGLAGQLKGKKQRRGGVMVKKIPFAGVKKMNLLDHLRRANQRLSSVTKLVDSMTMLMTTSLYGLLAGNVKQPYPYRYAHETQPVVMAWGAPGQPWEDYMLLHRDRRTQVQASIFYHGYDVPSMGIPSVFKFPGRTKKRRMLAMPAAGVLGSINFYDARTKRGEIEKDRRIALGREVENVDPTNVLPYLIEEELVRKYGLSRLKGHASLADMEKHGRVPKQMAGRVAKGTMVKK